jgi:hypothetical protein
MSGTDNGWAEHKMLVVSELDRLSREVAVLHGTVNSLREDIAAIKAKFLVLGGIFGVVGGGLVVAITKAMGS